MGLVGGYAFAQIGSDISGDRRSTEYPSAEGATGTDIRAFGAAPDGSVSSVPAVRRALTHIEAQQRSVDGTPELVGEVVFAAGDYLIDSPIELGAYQSVRIEADARVVVPAGYSGVVFRVASEDGVRATTVHGRGHVIEAGKSGGHRTRPGQWTFIEFDARNSGVSSVDVDGLSVWWPGTFARYTARGQGWINGVRVSGTHVYYPGVLLDITASEASRVNYNTWTGVRTQAGAGTRFGIRNLVGRSWSFQDVVVWDLYHNPSASSAVITRRAEGTVILGGNVTRQNYRDLGVDTVVTDRWNVDRAGALSPEG